jgi:hypothetical protein
MTRIENDLGKGSGRNTMRWGIIKPPKPPIMRRRRIVSRLVVFHLSPGKKNIAAKVPSGTLLFFNRMVGISGGFLSCAKLGKDVDRVHPVLPGVSHASDFPGAVKCFATRDTKSPMRPLCLSCRVPLERQARPND